MCDTAELAYSACSGRMATTAAAATSSTNCVGRIADRRVGGRSPGPRPSGTSVVRLLPLSPPPCHALARVNGPCRARWRECGGRAVLRAVACLVKWTELAVRSLQNVCARVYSAQGGGVYVRIMQIEFCQGGQGGLYTEDYLQQHFPSLADCPSSPPLRPSSPPSPPFIPPSPPMPPTPELFPCLKFKTCKLKVVNILY